jgi:NAD(P)-dependent dehydrogenase (short-subunit alcohol dehydrogenase family)
MTSPEQRKAIVVGASSGIGRAIAERLAADGWLVAIVARRAERLEEVARGFPSQMHPFPHDVQAVDEVPDLLAEIALRLGGLDALIYAAGVMPSVAPDSYPTGQDMEMIATNFAGAVAWCNAAAARFSGAGAGSIVGIGSVAGDRGRRAQPVYNATKGAFAIYLEALRNRLTAQGVAVTTIKPGPTATPMTEGLPLKRMATPAQVARFTVRRIGRPGEFYVRPVHRMVFAVIRLLPGRLMRRLPL